MSAPSHFEGDGYDLERYVKYRIVYEPSFYDIIYEYHNSHGGKWVLAHDVGTGPGIVAQALATRFAKVVASDINEKQIVTARKNFEASHPNIRFEHCRAEEVAHLADEDRYGEADLIVVAETISLLQVEVAIAGFLKTLRQNGTLAIWFYGRLIFAETGRDRCQNIHNRILAKIIQKVAPLKDTPMERSLTVLASWLDSVELPSRDWVNIQRLKWNADKPLTFLDNKDLDFKPVWDSKITPDENVEQKIDRDFWAIEDCDAKWIKGYIENLIPWPPNPEIDAQLDLLFKELEDAMGGKNAKAKVCWPVVLLLATKKKSS